MGNCDLLIVDDRAGVRRLLYEVFSEEGYQVELAAGGQEALTKVTYLKPAVILLDIKMPGMNGLETLQELRKIHPEAAVIMITAYGEFEMICRAQKLGVQHYINKPFDLLEVRKLIETLLPGQRPAGKYLSLMG